MVNDLTELGERLDFCEAELKVLGKEIEIFLQGAMEVRSVKEPNHLAIQMRVTQSIPVPIRSRLGIIIHEGRSCLDSLACVLANRNGKDAKGVYFPVSKSETIFAEDGLKKIKKLSDEDQGKIASLKPYGGGNDFLFGMHEFDRSRKHQRLGLSYAGFSGMNLIYAENFHLIEMKFIPRLTADWQTIGTFSLTSIFEAQFHAGPSFEEPTQLKNLGILKGAQEFITIVREIIANLES